ncbi:MAG: hypothetical protein JWO37_2013, partial [Acidimicrobiales bacterium]|nr:hypothetical protein [Acidimicrobiales bacterium]
MLALAAADAFGATAIGLAAVATIARYGTSSLAAVTGAQAVVGAAGWTGPASLIASSWCAAIACALAGGRRWSTAVACGIAAGLLVAGPSAVTARGAAVRAAGAAVAVALALAAGRFVPY